MKEMLIIATLALILSLPEIIKLIRIRHMKSLGYRYEGDQLVRIQKDN